MQTMRDKWTDERLDDLNAKVDRGFEELKAEIRAMRAEMNARFDEVNRWVDAQNRTMLWFAGALLVAIVGSSLGIIASILAF